MWSIPFLFCACGNSSLKETQKVNPNDCEWYINAAKENAFSSNNKLDVYMLRLYPSGEYVLCADLLYEPGIWIFDSEKKLIILSPLQKKEINTQRFLHDETIGGTTTFTFYHSYPIEKEEADELIYVRSIANKSISDPYHPSNHQWRKQPNAVETNDQIKTRTLAYLNFLKIFYTHAKENELENVGGSWYPQPLRFYSNMVRMAYDNELADWYSCFYNEEQGIEAYKLLSGALRNVKIIGSTDISRNLNGVEQLLAQVQK